MISKGYLRPLVNCNRLILSNTSVELQCIGKSGTTLPLRNGRSKGFPGRWCRPGGYSHDKGSAVLKYRSTYEAMTCEYPPGFSTRRHRLKTPKFLHLIHERGKAKERRKLQLDFPPSSLGIFSSLPPFSYSRHGGLR